MYTAYEQTISATGKYAYLQQIYILGQLNPTHPVETSVLVNGWCVGCNATIIEKINGGC